MIGGPADPVVIVVDGVALVAEPGLDPALDADADTVGDGEMVDEEIALSNLNLVLAPDKRKLIVHLLQKRANAFRQSPFELSLTMGILQVQEGERVLVFHRQLSVNRGRRV